ncbi:MAG: hypothetical protein JRI89_17920 [Deltaproteobacteria bacterium]|nr:hypothetical protein [Deltaproteobacteria bacterium]
MDVAQEEELRVLLRKLQDEEALQASRLTKIRQLREEVEQELLEAEGKPLQG